MAKDPERAILTVICTYPHDEQGLGAEDRKTYDRAGAVYHELIGQGLQPVVVIGHASGVRIEEEEERIALISRVRNYLAEEGLIPEDHILFPATGYPGEDAEAISWRHKKRLEGQYQHPIKTHVVKHR